MQTSQGLTGTGTRLPARVIVRLPDLTIVATGAGDDEPWLGTLVSAVFAPEAVEMIADDVLPQLLENEVWSGELAPHVDADAAIDTTFTLWVPHQRVAGPPDHATVLIGTAATSSRTSVAPDPLTGLPTRLVLLDRVDVARRRSRRNGDLMATLFVDLDGLKAINDRLGHEEGDSALMHTAARIRSCLRDGDTVARFGGDEFVVLCESLEHESQAERVAERILSTLTGDPDRPVSASIGIAYDRSGRLDALELISRADAAMYRAKAGGGARFEVFDREMQGRLAADQSLREHLLEAIDRNAFEVAAQPLFALRSGRIVGVETFIRMAHRDRLVVGRDVLRLARERSTKIDEAMLRRACGLASAWRRDFGRSAPRVHVNVAAQSVASTSFTELAMQALADHRLPAGAVAFEVTSGDMAPIGQREMATLAGLQKRGFAIVIDGFGIGPATLQLIDRVRPALVKVSAAPIDGEPETDERVIIALVRAVRSLGLSACVKGLEQHELLDRLVTAGTYAGQGHVLAPVTDATEVRRLLAARETIGY